MSILRLFLQTIRFKSCRCTSEVSLYLGANLLKFAVVMPSTMLQRLLTIVLILATIVSGLPPRFSARPYHEVNSKRAESASSSSPLVVDLGYEIYQGVANAATGLNNFFGYHLILLMPLLADLTNIAYVTQPLRQAC